MLWRRSGSKRGVDVFAGTGCVDSDELCPQEPLLRWEMAAWLVRILDRADPPAISSSRFADVDASAWWAPHAERLAELGIAMGCDTEPLQFCPDDPVDRGQMAAILVLAFNLPPAERAWFVDVNAEHPFAEAIDRIAGWGVTAGCGVDPARYCPQQNVSRAQMATFLARTLRRVGLPRPVATVYEPAQDATLLPVDPDVVIGTLDNGLTYYLRPNDSPGKNLSVRLLINIGSVDETDEEAGIGHFIEHMLFNGTTDYPGNSLGETLREIGVELGPDINAHVGHDETVYQIAVRLDAPHKAPLVFHALSQMAGAATFEDDAVESERGIVLDEMRLGRESVNGFINSEFDRVYTQGTAYEGRDPVGTIDTVSSMTPEMLRVFYEKWYVPSNMAVVVVGDLPVEHLKALVEGHLGPLPSGEGRQPPSVDITPAGSSSHVVTDARQGVTFISLDIPITPHNLNTAGGDRLEDDGIPHRGDDPEPPQRRLPPGRAEPGRPAAILKLRLQPRAEVLRNELAGRQPRHRLQRLPLGASDRTGARLHPRRPAAGRQPDRGLPAVPARQRLNNPGQSVGWPLPGALLLRGRHRRPREVGGADRRAAGGAHTRGN